MSDPLDTIVLWRDSVAAGDDADAPHEWRMPISGETTIADVATRIASAGWLASITTGEATWIVEGARPLAVLAQQWPEPRHLVAPSTRVHDLVDRAGKPHLQARYWLQVNPDRVFEALRDGRPLPDRYGRETRG
jgi:hypothetical protein